MAVRKLRLGRESNKRTGGGRGKKGACGGTRKYDSRGPRK